MKLEPAEDDQLHPLEKLKEQLHAYLMELPVLAFNSSRYDIKLIKPALMTCLQQRHGVDFVVRKNNTYACLKTKTLKFLNICNFLAQGVNYDMYLKAFGCSQTKGFLPFEWITSLDKLKHPKLLEHASFYGQLKGKNITEEQYAYCQRIWEDHNMQTFADFVRWYNNLDTAPFLEAIEKQSAFYRERGIDMFKDGISVPGLTMKFLFQTLPRDVFFTLYDKKNHDLYHLVKDNIVGGPSIVFHRYHEKSLTKLREADYGKDEAKLCQGILGLDQNALYLSALMEDMPTGWYVRRQNQLPPPGAAGPAPEKNFKAETSHSYSRPALEWLEWIMAREGIEIRHGFNGLEKRLGRRQLPVDGWCAATQTVYQLHGCFYHGHQCRLNPTKQFNDLRKKSMEELRDETARNTAYLRRLGYTVVELWECQWQQMKAENKDLQCFIATHFRRRLDRRRHMTQAQILDAVRSGELFGLVECDINVPPKLQKYFSEMQPLFKNINITRDDIGETMRAHAEQHNLLTQPRRSLIGSFKGEKILLITPLIQWYLSHGLVITHIYQVIQYWPDNCFQKFGENVSDARRDGDSDFHLSIFEEKNVGILL